LPKTDRGKEQRREGFSRGEGIRWKGTAPATKPKEGGTWGKKTLNQNAPARSLATCQVDQNCKREPGRPKKKKRKLGQNLWAGRQEKKNEGGIVFQGRNLDSS